MTRRKKPTMQEKLDTALLQLGLDPARVRLDHTPPLAMRERTPDGGYIPAENDPRHMQWLDTAVHDTKTFGRGGEKRATTAGSDIANIAKMKRIREAEFNRHLLATDKGAPKPRSKWPTRKMRRR